MDLGRAACAANRCCNASVGGFGVGVLAGGRGLKCVVVFNRTDIARWAPLDRLTHRCIWDPSAEGGAIVPHHARALLAGMAPGRRRSVGMWP